MDRQGEPVKRALAFLARRLVWAVLMVALVSSLSFALSQLLPGDPGRIILGPQASAADVQRARENYGLDKPPYERFVLYWKRLVHSGPKVIDRKKDKDHASCAALVGPLHVDLGYSFYWGKPVVDLLAAKIPKSLELGLVALLFQALFGIGLGILAGSRRGTSIDRATIGAALVGASAPTFLLALVLQYILAYKLRLLPYDGYGATPSEHFRSILLPALTLGVFGTALYARLVRDEVATGLSLDFVRTARAKGASNARVLVVHVLRASLLPIATLLALDLGTIVGGAVVTEKIFRWPGVGQMAVDAVVNRDGPAIFGTVLFSSTAVVASTLLLDVMAVFIDPRARRK